ncbi:Uncharacterised protein [Aeromonas salmonicida]|uniref:DUF4145 domain-containing protein n=1 Tax=Aeromonas salmonicida TaxID=645 RepID=UPI001027E14D|nr:DUF4145 domain-containing protein [Aeromonas salmonicida]VFB09265.1 Uncharacterised protein [Aeromonas salmonicida]
MSVKFSWLCPYCNRNATITDSNFTSAVHFFDHDNKDGKLGIQTEVITCPNADCREYMITGSLHESYFNGHHRVIQDELLMSWSMKPSSLAKQFPTYIPKVIIDDYEEACLIRDLSPKASATLSRRCLQGIIRDFWGCKKGRLVDEINSIKEKVDPITWQAIDSVRSIGNIGAHMEKDINLIIDVESEEAQLLIGLIEILIKDWYVAKHERQKHLESIIGVAKQKIDEKSNSSM